MALELMDEHEKGETVRAWLRQNGSSIITGISIGLALIFGWQWWQGNKIEHRVTAATQYQALADAMERKEPETVSALAQELAKSYPDTPYAALAKLQVADLKLAAGDHEAAAQALADVATLTKDPALSGLASLRRARVTLSSGDAAAALKQAEAIPPAMYEGLAAEVRGDALQALGRTDDAREAYRNALTLLDTGAPNRRIVEMKLADIGGVIEQPEA